MKRSYFITHPVKNLTMVFINGALLAFLFFFTNNLPLVSQTNMVDNDSFEIMYNIPERINPDDEGAEVTRCLCWWIACYDTVDFDKYFSPVSCIGWYQPTEATSDYFRSSATNPDCGVPENIVNDQSPSTQYPANYGTGTTQKSYCGFMARRKFENGVMDSTYDSPKGEYIQVKLNSPMLPGHCYSVSFKTSRAPDKNFAINQVAALFTHDTIGVFYNDINPIIVDETDSRLAWPIQMAGEYLIQDGGSDGTRWINIEDEISLDVNSDTLYYITIGNFQNPWSADNIISTNGTLIDQWGEVSIYYYIDDVQVCEIEDCSCDCMKNTVSGFQDLYNIYTKPIPKESEADSCCFELYIDVLPHHRICHADRIDVYKDNNLLFSENMEISPGTNEKIGEFCVNKDLYDSSIVLDFELYQNNDLKCEFSNNFHIKCECLCEPSLPANPKLYFELEKASETDEKCCWYIYMINEYDKCDKIINSINIQYEDSFYDPDSTIQDYWDIEFIDNSVTFINKLRSFDNGYKRPGRISQFGKLCLPRDGIEREINITYTTSDEDTCNYEFSQIINCSVCDTLTIDSCDIIEINIGESFGINPCCQSFNFSKNYDCIDIYGLNIYKIDCFDGYIFLDSIRKNKNIDSLEQPYILCLPNCFPDPDRRVKIEFIDLNGNIICIKEIIFPPCVPSTKRGLPYVSKDKNIDNITCKPNPADNEIIISFDANINEEYNIKIFDIFGNEAIINKIGKTLIGNNEIDIQTNMLVSGKYIVQISFNGNIYSIPLTIIK